MGRALGQDSKGSFQSLRPPTPPAQSSLARLRLPPHPTPPPRSLEPLSATSRALWTPPHPHPQGAQLQATPAAVAAAPTWNVCHVVLELPGEKRVPRLKASPIPAGAWVPKGVWPLRGLPLSKPGPGGVGGNALCRPVPGAGGSGTCFLPNPGPQVSALGGQIQDPESGSRIGSGPALGAAQRPGGCAGGSSPSAAGGQAGFGGFSGRWGGLQRQPLREKRRPRARYCRRWTNARP